MAAHLVPIMVWDPHFECHPVSKVHCDQVGKAGVHNKKQVQASTSQRLEQRKPCGRCYANADGQADGTPQMFWHIPPLDWHQCSHLM